MDFEVRIKPKSNLALVDFPELWRYKDLLSMLVWREFTVKYKQTLLGPVWFLLQPLLPAIIFTLIFGKIAAISTDGTPSFIFFLSGQIIWGYLAANYSTTATCLLSNMNLFTKVYIPRLVPPLSNLAFNAIAVSIQLLLFVAAWLWYKFGTTEGASLQITPYILFLPLLFLLAAIQGFGIGLWMASLTAKYRDLQQLSTVLIQLWMYGSAVIFPLSQVPEQYRFYVSLNPATFLTESFRFCLVGQGTLTLSAGLFSVGLTALITVSGLYIFNRTARSFVDTV